MGHDLEACVVGWRKQSIDLPLARRGAESVDGDEAIRSDVSPGDEGPSCSPQQRACAWGRSCRAFSRARTRLCRQCQQNGRAQMGVVVTIDVGRIAVIQRAKALQLIRDASSHKAAQEWVVTEALHATSHKATRSCSLTFANCLRRTRILERLGEGEVQADRKLTRLGNRRGSLAVAH